ncbi:hypothetical protein GCM10027036_15350 [Flavihumibacter cheonanensis]|jgi:hypothetical protein|uniref:hypothetical protein n=1 Tax=Flavihumibacter cheonanensis TaxID=1442385 RepID=UPI001EF901C9|nr:hypothetical protein [Flavihumibacter cheonanensis]MCG7751026.1 hypothetical protein [Flavihumibacter cheonanensis]
MKKDQQLKLENELLKIRLLAETGAVVHIDSDASPEMEHAFLQMVLTIESQYPLKKTTVHNFIGEPLLPVLEHLKTEQDCSLEVEKLLQVLDLNSIDVVFPEHLSWKEMLRFLVQDLMPEPIDDIRMPQLRALFFYDTFHPDSPVFLPN